VLPAYWSCWREPIDGRSHQIRIALTLLLAFTVWWAFLVGHVINNIGGFGA
jgi:hypothetical protein